MKLIPSLLTRHTIIDDAAMLCGLLAAGSWIIEAGCTHLTAHDPAGLPAWAELSGGTALSLTSATALRLNIGAALVNWLERTGSAVAPMAGLALHELIVNAVVHGNLAVSCGQLDGWRDLNTQHAMIAASLDNPLHAARLVTIALGWTRGRVVAVIVDEGSGYEPALLVRSGRGSGRGLRIASSVGEMEVLLGGRQTVLTLSCPPTRVER